MVRGTRSRLTNEGPTRTIHRSRASSRRVLATVVVGALVTVGVLAALAWSFDLLPRATESPSAAPTVSEARTPPGSPESGPIDKPVIAPEVESEDVRDELRGAFGETVTSVEIQASGSDMVRLDITTTLALRPEDVAVALELAVAGAKSEAVVASYPDVTLSAYVWPAEGQSYMTRATAFWANGALQSDPDTYVDSGLQ